MLLYEQPFRLPGNASPIKYLKYIHKLRLPEKTLGKILIVRVSLIR